MCVRYQVSDQAGAPIVNSVLQEAGIISPSDKLFVIDKNKLKRQRNKYRQEIRAEKDRFFELVNGIYVDGRQDATVVLTIGKNDKTFMKTTLEEYYVMVGEPKGFYLYHFSLPNGKGQTLALHIHSAIKNRKLEQNLVFIGSDGTPSMTGHTNGLIAALKKLLKRPLQWVICLLHCVESPICYVFTALDGSTTSPESFGESIEKKL